MLRFRRVARSCLLAAPMLAFACGEELEPRPDAELADDGLRLGRVHVVLERAPDAGLPDDSGQLQVTARFAFVRGLEEEFVRARVGMPVLAHDILQPSQCNIDDQVTGVDGGELGDEPRELVLVDAGELRVGVGEERVQIPLSLVPDLLPYMSGVEYLYYGQTHSDDTDGALGVVVEADGSQSDELPPFSVEGQMPLALDLYTSSDDLAELERDVLVLRWQATDAGTVTMRLTPQIGGDPAGDDITCVFEDRGQSAIDLSVLRTLGLPAEADALTITGSRITSTTFDAGDFGGTELVIERRAHLTVPLP
jgi:hypothetical protein